MSMPKITVIIVDDHPAFLEGLSQILSQEPDIEVAGKFLDAEEASKQICKLQPDIAIVDVAMPKVDGLELARQIRTTCQNTAILMLSAFAYESYLLHSLQAGARGYLLKSSPLSEIVGAIRSVHTGKLVFDFQAGGELLSKIIVDNVESKKPIASRPLQAEREVLELVAKGMSNKEIAHLLCINERTVQARLVSVFRKLGVNTRTEAVVHALKSGWLILDNLS